MDQERPRLAVNHEGGVALEPDIHDVEEEGRFNLHNAKHASPANPTLP